MADGEQNGTVQDRIQRSTALDEGCFPGAGSRHTQTDGEIQEGLSCSAQQAVTPLKPVVIGSNIQHSIMYTMKLF